MDCCPPGSSVHGISQARILEQVAISFSRESSQPRGWTCISCIGKRSLYLYLGSPRCSLAGILWLESSQGCCQDVGSSEGLTGGSSSGLPMWDSVPCCLMPRGFLQFLVIENVRVRCKMDSAGRGEDSVGENWKCCPGPRPPMLCPSYWLDFMSEGLEEIPLNI